MLKKLMTVLPILSLMAGAAVAEDAYPTRPIRLVHGFAAGGNADAVARILADKMSLGQPVVVESKPGAGGNVASDYVSKSAADGYTIQLMVGGHTVSAVLYKSLPYKPVADYEFISIIGKFPFYIAARAGAYGSLADLIAKAKAAPGTIKIGHAGVGTTQHLTGELLGLRTATKFVHVPYKGGAAASTALLGGEVDVLIDAGTVIRGQAKAGGFDILGVTSKTRWPDSPDVPTVAETVSPEFDIISWTGIGVPNGTPAPVAGKIRAEVHRVLALPDVQKRLRALGAEPSPSSGEDMKAMVEMQIDVWKDVIKAAGIKKR